MINQRMAAPGPPRFKIGRVLAVALGVSLRNILPFVVISVVIAMPGFVCSYWYQTLPRDPQQGIFKGHTLLFLVSLALSVACTAISQAVITYGTLQALRGESVLISACLRRGIAAAPKCVAASILSSLMIFIPMILLIIPGLIVATIFWLCVPAIVVENAGIIESFGRSRDLTKGRRWQIFGVFLLAMALYIGLEVFVATRIGLQNFTVVNVVIGVSAFTVLLTTYASVMTAVGYYYLRAEKERIAIDDIAAVFG
jgi:hypothetical protein